MRVRVALVPLVAMAALLAGCTSTPNLTVATTTGPVDNGVAAESADEILAKAKAALSTAPSFHVKGEATVDGAKVQADLRFSGKNYAGPVDTNGAVIDFIRLGDDLYLKTTASVWKSMLPSSGQESAIALIAGRWVKIDATNAAFGASFDYFRSDHLFDVFRIDNLVRTVDGVTKTEAKTINGVPAIGVADSDANSIIYVSTVDQPYPLRIEHTAGPGALDFSEYGAIFYLKPPPAGEVLDLKSLMGG